MQQKQKQNRNIIIHETQEDGMVICVLLPFFFFIMFSSFFLCLLRFFVEQPPTPLGSGDLEYAASTGVVLQRGIRIDLDLHSRPIFFVPVMQQQPQLE